MSEETQITMVKLPAAEGRRMADIPYPVSSADKVFAGLMFVLAYLAMDSFSIFLNPAYYGVGVTGFTLLYGAACLVYARGAGV